MMERKQAITRETVEEVKRLAVENKSRLWKTAAKALSTPRRKGYNVNLFKIEKFAKARETLIVPGSVLGVGELSKPVTVAALRFSGRAKEMIEEAGGSCLTIKELAEKNPKGDKIRMMR